MQVISANSTLPLFSLEPDEVSNNKHFRVYNFEGSMPSQSDLLIPHRKDYYLFVFMRKGGSRIWVDMTPYELKANTLYFTHPNQVIVKEGIEQLWSTGIAFTGEFLSLLHNTSLASLSLIQNLQGTNELMLTDTDIIFVEDTIAKINEEYLRHGEWQQRMLGAYLTVLITYLSRLYTEQHTVSMAPSEQLLLKKFHARIDENFHEFHEVGHYASMLNISAGHLSEVVKNQSGQPAIKHIHDRLIMEARRMLFHTENSLKEIAFDLGFSDTSYFNRFFKRETGVTPAAYRVEIREMYH